MRISLTIFALAALCFVQDAFAQAPKEVIVVDGQIAVNSMPEVMLQGATNPIPVVDVSSKGEPFIVGLLGDSAGLGATSRATFDPGRPFKITGVSLNFIGDSDASFSFSITTSCVGGSNLGISLGEPYVYKVSPGPGNNHDPQRTVASVSKEFADFPFCNFPMHFTGNRYRPGLGSGEPSTISAAMTGTLWGYYLSANP